MTATRAIARCLIAGALVAVAMNGCASDAEEIPDPGQPPLEVRLQRTVEDYLSSRLVPGASVSVIAGDEHVDVVSGVADVDAGRPVTRTTRFRVASVAKMYVAAIVLRMAERGDVMLDEAIGRRGLARRGPFAFASRLTLRQLLSHTSGLGQTFVRDEDRGQPLSPVDLVEQLPPPVCAPSDCWSYSDVNYVLIELVLEAETGRSLRDLFRAELIEPFGLRDTTLVDPVDSNMALPPQYALESDESGEPVEPLHLFEQRFPLIPTLITTAADAARFADELFDGAVLDPSTLAEMLDTGVMSDLPCPAGCPFEYSLGVFHLDLAGHRLVGHDGSSGTVVVHDRSRDLTVAIMTNGGDQDMGAFLERVIAATVGAG